MPIMQVHHADGALDAKQKAALAERLTNVLLTMEGGANTEGGRAFAWVMFYPIATGDWYVGGRTDMRHVAPPGKFLVHVTIPEGYMNSTHKREVQAGVTGAILDVLGVDVPGATASPDAGASILVVIDEVTEGNWAARGLPISIASIAGTVGLPKNGERFAWVEAYFAAKARQFTAAGYPVDTGGLLDVSPNVTR
jgi:phenylpyruvate tautomerase PptA (4-oxalocrotonate tautomerase family)